MSVILYIILFLLLLLFSISILLFFVFILDLLKGHDLPTSKLAIKSLVKIMSYYKPGACRFYDLGCGRGAVVLAVKKELPAFTVYGIDNNIIRIFFSKLKSKLLRLKINFKKMDIFQIDLRDADVIYAYLWYDLMPLLEKKLQKELKKGSIVVTNTSSFPTWKPVKTYILCPKNPHFEKLFVYVKE